MDSDLPTYQRNRANCLTLNSVGTISLGVLSPINMSRPTKVIMDMKMEKSLMSFLSWEQEVPRRTRQNNSFQKHVYCHENLRKLKKTYFDTHVECFENLICALIGFRFTRIIRSFCKGFFLFVSISPHENEMQVQGIGSNMTDSSNMTLWFPESMKDSHPN